MGEAGIGADLHREGGDPELPAGIGHGALILPDIVGIGQPVAGPGAELSGVGHGALIVVAVDAGVAEIDHIARHVDIQKGGVGILLHHPYYGPGLRRGGGVGAAVVGAGGDGALLLPEAGEVPVDVRTPDVGLPLGGPLFRALHRLQSGRVLRGVKALLGHVDAVGIHPGEHHEGVFIQQLPQRIAVKAALGLVGVGIPVQDLQQEVRGLVLPGMGAGLGVDVFLPPAEADHGDVPALTGAAGRGQADEPGIVDRQLPQTDRHLLVVDILFRIHQVLGGPQAAQGPERPGQDHSRLGAANRLLGGEAPLPGPADDLAALQQIHLLPGVIGDLGVVLKNSPRQNVAQLPAQDLRQPRRQDAHLLPGDGAVRREGAGTGARGDPVLGSPDGGLLIPGLRRNVGEAGPVDALPLLVQRGEPDRRRAGAAVEHGDKHGPGQGLVRGKARGLEPGCQALAVGKLQIGPGPMPLGVLYAGAQKNLAMAGVTIVIVKDEKLGKAPREIPTMLDYRTHVDKGSMFNTPPVVPIYSALETLRWIKKNGGVEAMDKLAQQRAEIVYGEIDRNKMFRGTAVVEDRSVMNICFVMADEYKELEKDFLDFATSKGMVGVKGHRSVGGFRASCYNAQTIEGCNALVACMKEFEANH